MMIKPIIASPMGRKIIATAMFATAVANTSATDLIQKDKTTNPLQTELITKEGAKALQTNAVRFEVPTFEHNRKLDKLYLKNCEPNKKDGNKRESLKAIYNVYGTYGATIEIQRAIDEEYIKRTINIFSEHYTLSKNTNITLPDKANEFYEWLNDVFYKDLYLEELKMYEEQSFPTFEKATEYIDKHINNNKFFTKEDKEIYLESSKNFKDKQVDKTSISAKSDLIAHKIHLLNSLAFNRYLLENNNIPEKYIFIYYFNKDFVNGSNSIKP